MNEELLEKVFHLLEENKICSTLYKEEVEKKFVSKFLDFTERVLDNKDDQNLSISFKYSDMLDDLETLLDSLDISIYKPLLEEVYNSKLHNPIGKITTDKIELNLKIADCKSSGFLKGKIVLKPANVIVYKYIVEGE